MKNLAQVKKHLNLWFSTLLFVLLACSTISVTQAQLDLPGKRLTLPGAAHVFQTPHAKAQLLAYAPEGIQPGEKIWFGVLLEHQPEWHTYWKNPGDIGLPTKLTWTVPAGVHVGEVQWPAPKIFPIDKQLLNYGYDGEVLLSVPVQVTKEFNAPELNIQLDISWLICRVECIPESGRLILTVPAQQTLASSAAIFETTLEHLPQKDDRVSVQLQVKDSPTPGVLIWKVAHLPQSMQGKPLQLLPENEEVMTTAGPLFAQWQQDTWSAAYALRDFRLNEPQTMSALLRVVDTEDPTSISRQQVLRIEAPVEGAWPVQKPISGTIEPPNTNAGTDKTGQTQKRFTSSQPNASFWSALLLAFLGGLLLNLMPCVFPVLSIKALTFAQPGISRRMHIISGGAYGIGVLTTMLILASVFLALRSASSGLGWGFQLQSPVFVALLSVLFTLIGLNLLGAFEVRIFIPSRIGELRGKTPAIDAFFSGIVSVLVATPCSAPAMGAAMGATLTMPAWQALMVFIMLGIGLALPLVLIAWLPGLANGLPKPGRWMETFRKAMAFPMFATVLWLVWVIGLQTSLEGAVALLAILLSLSLLMWAFGHTIQYKISTGKPLGMGQKAGLLLCLLLFAGITAWLAPILDTKAPSYSSSQEGRAWQPWSQAKANEMLAQNKTVFVDFTAAWCMTCQVNKRTTLRKSEVEKAFADKGVVLLEADWTRADPEIGKELERLGRNGLPVYVFYQKDKAPVLLPELLTPSIVYSALDAL